MDRDTALAVVRRYGLDTALTDEDDPALWAAVLLRHWRAPDDTELHVRGLRFGVGVPSEGASIRPVELWRFERVKGGLRAWHGEEVEEAEPPYPLLLLGVERPSMGRSEALADAGRVSGPRAASGAATLWRRREGGGWRETDDPVSVWIS